MTGQEQQVKGMNKQDKIIFVTLRSRVLRKCCKEIVSISDKTSK